MKALQHAQIAARRYGGEWQDWYDPELPAMALFWNGQ